MARDVESLLERAYTQMAQHHLRGAIETLRQVLSLDPDNAQAHALLATCLHDEKRLFAADHEARAALALDADLPCAHYAMAIKDAPRLARYEGIRLGLRLLRFLHTPQRAK
jgi:Flp pilus assembly protein TadD